MCIPHGVAQSRDSGGRIKRDKSAFKSIPKVSKEQFEKGDPQFKDERVHPHKERKRSSKKGWLASLFSL